MIGRIRSLLALAGGDAEAVGRKKAERTCKALRRELRAARTEAANEKDVLETERRAWKRRQAELEADAAALTKELEAAQAQNTLHEMEIDGLTQIITKNQAITQRDTEIAAIEGEVARKYRITNHGSNIPRTGAR